MPRQPAGTARRLPAAFDHPAFVRLWGSSIVSSIGTQANNVVKLWLLYQLTRSAVALGLEGLCFSIPIAVLPLVAGPLVDHLNRLLVIRTGMLLEILESLVLAALVAGGALQPWMIYLAAALAATRLSFAIPAGAAIIPALVPDSALLSAMSLAAVVWSSSALIGPAVAGLLLATTPTATVFGLNAVATLVALLVLRPLRYGTEPTAASSRKPAPRAADGLRYLLHGRHLPALQLVTFLTSTLLVGTETLLPVLAVNVWDAGTFGYALLRVAPGLAAVLAGVGLSMSRAQSNPFRAMMIGVTLACAGLAVFVQVPSLAMGFVLLTLATVALVGTQILVTTCIQQDTPDNLRGAVGGVTVISQSGLAGIAAAAMAVAAAAVGAPAALIVAAVTALPLAVACCTYAGRHRRQWGVGTAREPAAAARSRK